MKAKQTIVKVFQIEDWDFNKPKTVVVSVDGSKDDTGILEKAIVAEGKVVHSIFRQGQDDRYYSPNYSTYYTGDKEDKLIKINVQGEHTYKIGFKTLNVNDEYKDGREFLDGTWTEEVRITKWDNEAISNSFENLMITLIKNRVKLIETYEYFISTQYQRDTYKEPMFKSKIRSLGEIWISEEDAIKYNLEILDTKVI